MSLSSNTDATKRQTTKSQARARLENFPVDSIFVTEEQMQRFELLRLAFFVLKLRKLNEQMAQSVEEGMNEQDEQQFFFPAQPAPAHHFPPDLDVDEARCA